MPYDQSGNWVDEVNDYLSKNQNASDDEILKKFPKLGGKPENIHSALAYGQAKKGGAKQEDLDKMFPEFSTPMIKPGFISENKVEAPPVDNSIFDNKHVNKAIDKIAEDQHQKTFNTTNLQSTSEQQPLPKPYVKLLASELKEQREAFKEQLNVDSPAGRTVLEKAKDASNDPEFIGSTNDAFAGKDWGDKLTLETRAKIKSNEYGYDLLKKKPTIQLNPAQSFIQGVEDHYNDVNKADFIADAPKENVIKYEESQRGEHDPNKPIPKSKGWASAANAAGQSAAGFEKAILGGEIGAATGGGGTALGSLFVSHDAGKQAMGSTFTNVYHSLRDQEIPEDQAYDKAMELAKFNGGTSAASMAVMSAAGLKLGGQSLNGAVYGKGFKELLKSQIENVGTFAKRAIPEVGVMSGIAGGTQAIQNVKAGRPIDENVGEQMKQAAAFVGLLSAVGAAHESLKPAEVQTAMNGFAKDPKMAEMGINQAIIQKDLSPEQGDKLLADIKDQAKLNKGLPDDVPDENKQKIQNRLKKIDDLKQTIDKSNPDALHPAFHTETKEKIKKVEEEISELRKPIKEAPEPKEVSDITAKTDENVDNNQQSVESIKVRHAESEEDAAGIISGGKSKTPLTERGKQQASDLADDLVDHDITKIVTPETTRNKQTADIVSEKTGAPVETHPDLHSWHVGDFTKMPDEHFEAVKDFFVNHPDETEHKGEKVGESFNEYKDRVVKAMSEIPEDPHTLIIQPSNNIMLENAIKDNGGWNDAARKQYLTSKSPKMAELPEHRQEVKGTTDEETAALKEHGEEAAQKAVAEAPLTTPEDIQTEIKKLKIKKSGPKKSSSSPSGNSKAGDTNGELLPTVREGAKTEQTGSKGDDGAEPSPAKLSIDEPVGKGGENTRPEPVPAEKNIKFAYAGGKVEGTIVKDNGSTVDIKGKDGFNYPKVEKKHILKEGESINDHYDSKAKIKEGIKQALPKLGEANTSEPRTTPKQYSDPVRALDSIRAEHPKDVLMNRAADFLEPILKKNPQIRIEDADLGGRVLGLSHPDGLVQVDFAAHQNAEEAHRTVLHELIHGAVRNEIDNNSAFRTQLENDLDQVRKHLKLPLGTVGDKLISALVDRNIVPAEKYGASNVHELVSELFSNQKFNDMLKEIKLGGDTMLKKMWRNIVDALNKHFGILGNLKNKMSSSDMAEYLMKLTEGTIKADEKFQSEGEALKKVGDDEDDVKIKNIIKRGWGVMPENEFKDLIKEETEFEPDRVERLFNEVKDSQKEKYEGSPQDLIKDALAQGKEAKKIGTKTENQTALSKAIKVAKRWYLDAQDNVSDVKSIIRQEKGREESEIEKQFKDSQHLTDYWNKVPKEQQLSFILSTEHPELLSGQSDEVKAMSAAYRGRLNTAFDRIAKFKPNLDYVQDFFSHFWKKPDEYKNHMAETMSKNPLEGSKYFTKERVFDDITKGLKKGYDLETTNPEELVRMTEIAAWKFETGNNIIDRMKAKGLLKFSTAKDIPKGWQTIKDPSFSKSAVYTDAEGNPAVATGHYMMPADVAKLMNNYLSVGIKGNVSKFIRNYNNIKNSVQLGVGVYHFSTTAIEGTINGVVNGIQKMSTLKPGNMLSGFYDVAASGTVVPNLVSQLSRGFKSISDYKKGQLSPDVQNLIDVNARVGRQKMYSLDAAYNLKKAYGKLMADGDFKQIPNLAWRALTYPLEAINKPLMEHWVPALKVGGYLKSLDAELASRPNMSPAEFQRAKERAWDSMDNRLGQVVYDNLFINKSVKDLAFAGIRSFGWTGGTIQAIAKGVGEVPLSAQRLFSGQGITQRTAYLIGLPLTVGFFGGMYHKLMSGTNPETLEDYFYPWDGTYNNDGTKHRVTLPSYMKDINSYANSPITTISHKTSPLVNDVIEVSSNKDFYGEQIYNKNDNAFQKGLDILKHEVGTMVPFSFKQAPGQDKSVIEQLGTKQGIEQKFGVMTAPKEAVRSKTENKIMSAFVDQVEGGPALTHAEAEQRVARRHVKDLLHAGANYNSIPADVRVKANVHNLGQFIREAKEDPYIVYFSKLKDATKIELFKDMTPEERKKYDPRGKIAREVKLQPQ